MDRPVTMSRTAGFQVFGLMAVLFLLGMSGCLRGCDECTTNEDCPAGDECVEGLCESKSPTFEMPLVQYFLSSNEPGASPSHQIMIESFTDSLQASKIFAFYPTFTFNGFLSLAPPNTQVGNLKVDLNGDGTPETELGVPRSINDDFAYVDLDNDETFDSECEPFIETFSGSVVLQITLPFGGDCNANIKTIPPGRGSLTIFPGLITNPSDPGNHSISLSAISVDPVTGDAGDNQSSFSVSIVVTIEAPTSPVCGNGMVEPGEDCDPPGSSINCVSLVCGDDCVCEPPSSFPVCGNNFLEAGEECDPPGSPCSLGGVPGAPLGVCSTSCICVPLGCGNGTVEAGEQCDPPGSVCGADPGPIGAICSNFCICAIPVDIDILPDDDPSPINLTSKGVIPVAIFTTDTFDATKVDPCTVCFGDAEDPAQRDCTEAHGTGHTEDVDGDGDQDLVLHFNPQETGIDSGDTEACLTGLTVDDASIAGCDDIVEQGPSKECPCYTKEAILQGQQSFKSSFADAVCGCEQFPATGKPQFFSKTCTSSSTEQMVEWSVNFEESTCLRDTRAIGGDLFQAAAVARSCFALLSEVCASEGL